MTVAPAFRPQQAQAASVRTGGVVFLCPSHWGIRNVLHSGLRDRVRERGIPVYLAAGTARPDHSWYPVAPADRIRAEHAGAEVDHGCDAFIELGPPPTLTSARGWASLEALQRASYFRRCGIVADRNTNWWYRRADSRWERVRNRAVDLVSGVASRDPLYEWQLRTLARLKRRVWDLRPAAAALAALRPSLVVATSCVIWVEEPYLLAAADAGIPTLGCIQSFDNLTSRSAIPRCDHYALWNARMREQLLAFYPATCADRAIVTGTPQFDFHARPEFRWPRARTLAELGMRPDEHYVLYAANSFHHTPTEPELVASYADRFAQMPALRDRRIVVRLHPQDEFTRWSRFERENGRVLVSRPSTSSWRFTGPGDQARLVSTVAHADACVNMWSTMSLDAAAVDTPVICVSFAGERGGLEDRFCRMVYDTEYYRPIIESGGVRLASDLDQLVAHTVAYVSDRSVDREARARLAATECGELDGRATDRLAALIARIVGAP
jgi:hypothetical protein